MNVPTVTSWHEAGEYLSINGHEIFHLSMGSGEPLLVLHGFPTSSYDYARIAPLLAGHYRLILFDMLGYGYSDKPREHRYSLFDQADIAQNIATHYGVRRLSILTHDMGDSVTMQLLRRNTLEIEQVFMLNGSIIMAQARPLLIQRLLLHPLIGPLLTKLRLINQRTFARSFGSVFAAPPPPEEIAAFWSLIQHNDGAGIYHLLIRYLNERGIHEAAWLQAFAQSPAHIRLIWGERDPVARTQVAQAAHQLRPHTEYIGLADVGHYPQWEAPEQVAAAVLRD
jgi:pimeloyl-ACP methyl ester carboxylesterase